MNITRWLKKQYAIFRYPVALKGQRRLYALFNSFDRRYAALVELQELHPQLNTSIAYYVVTDQIGVLLTRLRDISQASTRIIDARKRRDQKNA